MNRRELITLLGGAAATWPIAAHAQQPMLVIGFLDLGSPGGTALRVSGFLKGLREIGYIDGQNLAIEYRGRKANSIDCLAWRLIWFAVMQPRSSRAAPLPCGR